MSTVQEVMQALEAKGTEQTRKTFRNHGAGDNMFGVKVSDLKVIAKTLRGDQTLALELYETGNSDAMYLAGMVVDGKKMTKAQLNDWAKKAGWSMISEYTVPWVASESPHGRDLAMKWIDSKKDSLATAGWNTYSGLLATIDDDDLDLDEIKALLKRIEKEIDGASSRVRYCMNGFVISVGTYVTSLSKEAKATAKKLGKVEVDMGGTACKVPNAIDYIAKVEKMGRVGKKRKTIRC